MRLGRETLARILQTNNMRYQRSRNSPPIYQVSYEKDGYKICLVITNDEENNIYEIKWTLKQISSTQTPLRMQNKLFEAYGFNPSSYQEDFLSPNKISVSRKCKSGELEDLLSKTRI